MITVSTSTILLFLLAVLLGAVLTLTGAALGALVVFRTKREPHESLFKIGPEKGEAFVMDDFGEDEGGTPGAGRKAQGEKKEDPFDPFPPPVRAAHEKLMVQMAKEKQA